MLHNNHLIFLSRYLFDIFWEYSLVYRAGELVFFGFKMCLFLQSYLAAMAKKLHCEHCLLLQTFSIGYWFYRNMDINARLCLKNFKSVGYKTRISKATVHYPSLCLFHELTAIVKQNSEV